MSPESVVGQCDSCHGHFKVPSANKAYRCPKCGGSIRAHSESPSDDPRETSEESSSPDDAFGQLRSCPNCQALNQPSSRYCEECGSDLQAGAKPRASTSGRRSDAVDETLARKELSKAWQTAKALRMLYVCGAIFTGWGARRAIGTLIWGDLQGTEYLAPLISATFFAVSVAGAVRILREPFLWSILLASFSTLNTLLLMLAAAPVWILSPFLLWTVGLWILVAPMARTQRLIRENPDLWVSRRFQGKRESHQASESRLKTRKRVASNRKVAQRQFLAIAGSVLGIVLVVVVIISLATAPRPMDEVAAEFTSSWNASNMTEIRAYLPPRTEEETTKRLSRIERMIGRSKERNGDRPLPSPSIDSPSSKQATLTYELNDESEKRHMRVTWRHEKGRWILQNIRLER